MPITIHPIATLAQLHDVERLQAEVWNLPDVEIVPLHVLTTAARNGGLLLGAFDGERLAGFVFGFPGLTPEGRLKHCSHMAGVHPAYRDQNLGYRLKLAQREHVLAQGIDLITWTFDPLEARNAWLNFGKLGAVCNTYLRNIYGNMRDGLNTGLPSDRLQVDWWIRSERVERRLRGEDDPPSSISSLRGRRAGSASDPLSPWERAGVRGDLRLVAIPANIQSIKSTDMTRALEWRMNTRRAFEDAFSQGYHAADVVWQADELCYLLQPAI
ncbi:MAG: hypothetical protein R2844_04965 [Caldilineales bacterium]